MHEVTSSHWHEPEGTKNAGYGAWNRPNTAYDDFMEAQGIPIFRGIGVRRVQDLPLAPWKRMGGRGSFIQLFGTEGADAAVMAAVDRRNGQVVERRPVLHPPLADQHNVARD